MVFSVQILGSNSALAAHGRHPTAQVVHCHKDIFLVDCGEGTQVRMSAFHVKRSRIRHIFISHLHGDHYFGLIGLLTSFHLMGRKSPLTIHAPEPLANIVHLQLQASDTKLNYDLTFKTTQAEQKQLILETESTRVYSIPLTHRIPTTGFLFEEKEGAYRINKTAIEHLKLLPEQYDALRAGQDITHENGTNIPNKSLTLPPYPPRRYAYCSDTIYMPELAKSIEGVDLLYHESTFLKIDGEKAIQTFHSTAEQAGKIAGLAKVKRLIIGHFSSKYVDLEPYLEEAQAEFPNTELALEGISFEIPRS